MLDIPLHLEPTYRVTLTLSAPDARTVNLSAPTQSLLLQAAPVLRGEKGDKGADGSSIASGVTFTPAGNLASTNVQAALQELDSEKLNLTGGTLSGLLELRNGTTGQALRLYNTYTDPSNYERGFLRWNGNYLELGTEAAGTGVARWLRLTGNTYVAGDLTFAGSGDHYVGGASTGINLKYTWWNGASNQPWLSLLNGGKVLIGTNTANSNGALLSLPVTGINIPAIGLSYNGKEWGIGIEHNTDRLAFSTTGAAMAVFRSSDNGATGFRFQGAGDRGGVSADAYYDFFVTVNNNYSSPVVYFDNMGGAYPSKVSIGASTPTAKLSVADAILSGSGALSGGLLDLAQTWNTTGTPTAIKLNVTDTASAVSSLFMDLRLGGVSKVALDKYGYGRFAGNILCGNTIGASLASLGTDGLVVSSSRTIGFSASNTFSQGGQDAQWARDAADTIAQRRGVNPQTFRLYNTFTDASNYERGFMRWASNVLEIGAEFAGTGKTRTLSFRTDTTSFTGGWRFHCPNAQSSRITFQGSDRSAQLSFDVGSIGVEGAGLYAHVAYAAGSNFGGRYALQHRNDNQTVIYFALIGSAAGVMQVNSGVGNGDGYGAAVELFEMTTPSAPPANGVRIYAEENGAGKTRLMARFATGAAVQLAIEP